MEKRILNVGCGDDLYGTDRLDIKKTSATTKVWDIEKGLPYEDEIFDEIKVRRVLECLRNLGFFIDECYRVLKKGGELKIITDHAGYLPHIKTEHSIPANKNKDILHKEDLHYNLFVKSHLKNFLCDFSKVEIEFDIPKRKWWKAIILKSFPFNLGKEGIRVVAVK